MILAAFLKALGQIGDPRFRRVLGLGILLALGLLIGASAGLLWLLDRALGEEITLPLLGQVAWLDDLLGWSSALAMLVLSVFLMIPVASAITSMMLDQVAQAVEDRHYPHLPPAAPVPITDVLRDTAGFLAVLVAANLAAIVLYLLFAPAALLIFWAVNGFLLGREYFTLVAMRRLGRDAARQLRRTHAGRIWLAGTLMAVPLTLPILNLIVPILGAATFTHIFHRLNSSGRTSPDRAP
ncbi:MAG: EI24 domain-containing protein [Rhodobacteraceae bacterium]|nr:EI24 domain-containing protein [Paracoccaceae bacterium]